MMQLACAIVALAACEGGGGSGPATPFDGESARLYAKAQLDFGARVPGTEAHRKAGDWIVAQMRQRADSVFTQEWTHTTADGKALPLRNIIARFRPELTTRVLYVTHWDSRPVSDQAADPAQRQLPVPGANDGASGVGMLVALGDVFRKTPPTVGVDLLFTDGEDWGEFSPVKDALLGATYFADHIPWPDYKPIFGVLWDMIGDRDLKIYRDPYSIDGAPEVVTRVWDAAARLGYQDAFVPADRSYGVTDDHLPLLAKGLRVIDVIDIDFPWHHTPEDTLDKVSARSLKIVGDVAVALVTSK